MGFVGMARNVPAIDTLDRGHAGNLSMPRGRTFTRFRSQDTPSPQCLQGQGRFLGIDEDGRGRDETSNRLTLNDL
jgi:hypothetical protein